MTRLDVGGVFSSIVFYWGLIKAPGFFVYKTGPLVKVKAHGGHWFCLQDPHPAIIFKSLRTAPRNSTGSPGPLKTEEKYLGPCPFCVKDGIAR